MIFSKLCMSPFVHAGSRVPTRLFHQLRFCRGKGWTSSSIYNAFGKSTAPKNAVAGGVGHAARHTSTIATAAELPAGARKAVGMWLMGCTGMVFGAVMLGGVTRLTESGLSMVDWKLLGRTWPQSEVEWQAELEKYRHYPEFQLKNQEISMSDFKFIWLMEYGHRMWGRLIGATFALPAVYFWYKGYFTKAMRRRVPVFGSLILLQGLMGWYMVKSGLDHKNFEGPSDVPRVSQYRLAAHLGAALVLATLFLYNGLDHLLPAQKVPVTTAVRRVRMMAHVSKGFIFLAAFSGAFVAGLDAGLTYNEFPLMGGRLVPSDLMAYKPALSNITENPTTVQFNHRVLGTTVFGLVHGLWYLSRKARLPPRAHMAVNAMLVMTYIQLTLGIATLLLYVPTPVAAAHQTGALTLLSLAVWMTHEVKLLKYVPK
ncbi:cytochrome c oxidase assembly protein COX15 homolog [Pollicipes pollicipes]|uniref:cytochrome c oxidase assembly protein COX15 homolog n=1 Tax=Pollicipes pollicipes TaxID=41117 RepID=UPI0018859143|nr:cytochrome c oxidase assembly protein COX15 homolog [Pollicipes pollicipes]XP_037067882.1 cytochrome c oxidase assembly protein COX15 homolog [Pollicipes pollicipes]XP_037067883.1 cytochrome c oxidase assembly protein COX15 homolog [Pollicipes pollicipes]